MREGTTSGVMAADMPYDEFYDFLQRQSGIFWIPPRIRCDLLDEVWSFHDGEYGL
jgi:hypothetical protein